MKRARFSPLCGAIALIFGAGIVTSCGGSEDEETTTTVEIDIQGTVLDLSQGMALATTPAAVGVVNSLAAMTGSVTLIASGTSTDAGSFALTSVDITDELGIIVITDDAPASGAYSFVPGEAAGGDLFPLATGVASYMAGRAKADINDAFAYTLPVAMVEQWQQIQGLSNLSEVGFALGMVLDTTTMHPLSGAVISSVAADVAIDVTYLGDDGAPASATESSGMFITIDDDLRNATVAKLMAGAVDLTSTASGYTCDTNTAPITPGAAFLVMLLCTPL